MNVTVPANENAYSVPFETGTLPADLSDVKIQVMLLESLQSKKIVFSTIEYEY